MITNTKHPVNFGEIHVPVQIRELVGIIGTLKGKGERTSWA